MRYSLRTLLILMLLVGPLSLWAWPKYLAWRASHEDAKAKLSVEELVRRARVRAAAQANITRLTMLNSQYNGGNKMLKQKPIKPGTPLSIYNEETGDYDQISECDPRYVEFARRYSTIAEVTIANESNPSTPHD